MTLVQVVTGDGVTTSITPFNEEFVSFARSRGARWNQVCWTFDARDDFAVREECRRIFGTDGTPCEMVTLKVSLDHLNTSESLVMFAGRELGRRGGKTTPVVLAPGVFVIAGGFPEKLPAALGLGALPGTALGMRDVPRSFAQRLRGKSPKVVEILVEQEDPKPEQVADSVKRTVDLLSALPSAEPAVLREVAEALEFVTHLLRADASRIEGAPDPKPTVAEPPIRSLRDAVRSVLARRPKPISHEASAAAYLLRLAIDTASDSSFESAYSPIRVVSDEHLAARLGVAALARAGGIRLASNRSDDNRADIQGRCDLFYTSERRFLELRYSTVKGKKGKSPDAWRAEAQEVDLEQALARFEVHGCLISLYNAYQAVESEQNNERQHRATRLAALIVASGATESSPFQQGTLTVHDRIVATVILADPGVLDDAKASAKQRDART